MYKSFRVKNFRCFKDLQINDLGRVNLIAGKNNTGKTALMEAMYIHSGNRDTRTLLRSSQPEWTLRYRTHLLPDFDERDRSVVSWDTVFHDFNSSEEIDLSAETFDSEPSLFDGPYESSVKLAAKSLDSHDLDDILAQLRVEEVDSFTDIDILAVTADYTRQSTYFAILDGSLVRSRQKTKPLHKSDFLFPRQILNEEINSTRFTNMRRQQRIPILLTALKVVEPGLNGLELWYDGRRPLIKCGIGLSQPLSLGDLGDGMNRVASLILAMSEVSGGVMFIDEIENGIHHSVQEQVWQAIGQASARAGHPSLRDDAQPRNDSRSIRGIQRMWRAGRLALASP
ncbi:MAG: AAA family ATPase [Chloroflexi bacterium]|nr:AAA family ATPase [Chloroflexota bacterium]